MYNVYKNHMFLHGTYVEPSDQTYGHDAVIACVKDVNTSVSKLQIIKDPKVECWVTKPGLRNFQYKKECSTLDELDTYVCEYRNMIPTLAKSLNIFNQNPYTLRKQIMSSPFVHGADIDPMIRIKNEYLMNCTKIAEEYNIGMSDIEIDVTGSNEINVLSYCDGATRVIYCGIVKRWLKGKTLEDLKKAQVKKFAEFESTLNPAAKKLWDRKPFTVEYNIVDDEREAIIWTMRKLVLCKPDFCGFWNMAFDIPYIIQRCIFRKINIVELMRHPDVPKEFACFEWQEDRRDVDHFTDVWHQVKWTGYTRFYDPMCLYSRLRKVKGRDLFYTLDYIGNKNLGSGKTSFGAHATHAAMQTNAFVDYCIYNCVDVIIPTLLDEKTKDVVSMLSLTGCSMLADFAKQTVQLKAQFYEYCKTKNRVPGTVGGSLETPYDKYIGNVGGAVLNPSLMKTKGVKCLIESDEETFVYQLICDLDVSSFYPSTTIAFNISRDTKLATLIWAPFCPHSMEEIEKEYKLIKDPKKRIKVKQNAEAIVNFFGRYATARENAVALCKEYFNIPGYTEFADLWSANLKANTTLIL